MSLVNICADRTARVARYPVLYGTSRISASISGLRERNHPGDKIFHIHEDHTTKYGYQVPKSCIRLSILSSLHSPPFSFVLEVGHLKSS